MGQILATRVTVRSLVIVWCLVAVVVAFPVKWACRAAETTGRRMNTA